MKVTLKKPHTHAGRELEPGAVIDVDTSTAQWLAEQEVIAPLSGVASAPSTTAPVAGKE